MNTFFIKLRDNPKVIKVYHFLLIIIGNALMSAAFGLFLMPAKIVAGGLAGIGTILESSFDFDGVTFVVYATWMLFFFGLMLLGKNFAIKTLISTIISPLFLALFSQWQWLIVRISAIDNKLIVAIMGAVFSGVGIGLVFRSGGSTGGVDIPGFIVQKYLKIPSERIIFILDVIVISFGLSVSLESVLLGTIVSIINLVVIDRITVGGKNLVAVHIISPKYQEINAYIMNRLSRGSTIIPAIGGYHSDEKMMIEAVIPIREFAYLSDFIKKTDPKAFVILLSAKDVYGLGFKDYPDI